MKLSDYIEQIGVNELARRLGCSKQLVSQWKNAEAAAAKGEVVRRPSPVLARRLEEISEGVVTAAEIRPDIYGGYRPPETRSPQD